ncbi:MAG TPA: PaaI family thioesterase, partial [Ktedonobacteraceae bacterium]|nr:PaaI family thioesterase [Ktedonobacteraceae bacterium]
MNQPDTSNDRIDGSEIIRRLLPNSPYVKHLGMQLLSMEKDRATLTLPFVEELITVGTTVHGGAIASLIDMAATVAAWSGAEVTA